MVLSEEDAVAKEGEACSSVHLAGNPLGLGVDALGRSVAVRECECGDHSVAVSLETAGEGVQIRQIGRADLGDPWVECISVFWLRLQK